MAKKGEFDFYCEEALTGKTPIKKLYESEKVLAFYHTKPAFEIHIVIIPKVHIHDLTQLETKHNNLYLEIKDAAIQITKDLGLVEKGARFITNMGKFQDTPHLHFHLISGDRL